MQTVFMNMCVCVCILKAGLGQSEDYERGQDILDIWFDSGTSWSTVLGKYVPICTCIH